ncbi:hypothetical protein BN3661_01283 [Eubacteriaceae bacterium CHKCI005]|nr:hypothetical protein BN3661_01283 [Eubacteriaceae bacterium CHKCI005]
MAPGLARLRKQKEKSGIESREAEDENKKNRSAKWLRALPGGTPSRNRTYN